MQPNGYHSSMFVVGMMVRMVVHGNVLVNNHIGEIKQLTPYGAIVSWHGGSGEFRLMHNEMQIAQATGNVCQRCGSSNQVRAGMCLLCLDCGDTSGGCN